MSQSSRRLLALSLAVCALLVHRPSARTLSIVDLLDRYAAGQFDDVVARFDAKFNFEDLLKELRRDAPAWIDTGGAADRDRRRLTAATVALEAARADEWYEWKWIQRVPQQPLSVLYWKPPPLLIEWGCELLRADATPLPIERWWQLAALAVAQRSEDVAFLVGDPYIGRGGQEIGNVQDEIKHLDHVQKRFPEEPRFLLAQGIARDRMWEDDATQVYTAALGVADIRGEAAMRFGAMHFRRGRLDPALDFLNRAETLTRDRYVVYLAAYLRGQIYERKKDSERAKAAYRRAVAAWPDGGQAAAISLSTMLFREGRRSEGQELAARVLASTQPAFDPWREFVHADDRFWPVLIRRLRAGIKQ